MKPRRTPGFTLIELLVVIAVIAVLAALLLPVLTRAKQKGQGAACLSNLHQIELGFRLYADDNAERFPDRRDLKSSLPGGYRPWSNWPLSDPRAGWAAIALRDYGVAGALWSCPSSLNGLFLEAVQCAQSTGTNAPQCTTRYWLWPFDRDDAVVPPNNFWGKTTASIIVDMKPGTNTSGGVPSGAANIELAVDVYFPNTTATVAPEQKGRAVHPGGRNRLYLDGHSAFIRDSRTPN